MNDPILTVITRHMPSKRGVLICRMNESLDPIRDQIQHLIIEDTVCSGLRGASELLVARKAEAIGEWVLILDDDDTFTCPQLPAVLRRISETINPNLIIAKHYIPLFGILPDKEHWQSKDILSFQLATIGMPGFIMRNDLFQEFIPNICDADIQVDWKLFRSIQSVWTERQFKSYWLDLLVMVQPVKLDCRDETGLCLSTKDKNILFGVE